MLGRSFAVLLLTACACAAQDWQALAQLHAGDKVRLTLKTQTVSGAFASFTTDQVIVGGTTAKRDDVLKVERYRHALSRGATAVIGAAIGGGAGAGIGAGVGGCKSGSIGPCISRGDAAGIVGGAGAVLGAIIGVLIPHRRTDVIYKAP
jgi:hypothetical protein